MNPKSVFISLVLLLLAGCEREEARPSCAVNDPDVGVSYTGECRDGLAHGEGHATGRDDYRGQFDAGDLHGRGRYTWGTESPWAGETYEGDFKRGRPDGKGKFSYPNGTVYEGDVVSGRSSGHGKTTFADGTSYEGGYRSSLFDGYGELRIALDALEKHPHSTRGWTEDDFYVERGMFREGKFRFACVDADECAARVQSHKDRTAALNNW
jgi:hypothetical protein